MQRLADRQKTRQKRYKSKLGVFKNKKYLIFGAVFVLSLAAFGSYLSGYSSRLVNIYPFIEIGESSTKLTCDYSGKNLSVDVKTHSNINNYYQNLALKNKINDGEYKQFVYANSSDNTFDELVLDIKGIAQKNGLNDDQTLELAACFIQNIPYDDAKAENVLGELSVDNYQLSQTPYETLYKNSGICTDKTYLGSLVLQKLGYSTAIMLFPDAEHMALGILAPSGYGDFNTKYTYMELTTPGFAPGEIPEDVSNANGRPAVSIKSFDDLTADIDPKSINYFSEKTISLPNAVIDVNKGKTYDRIKLVVDLEKKILSGIDNLVARQNTLELAYAELVRRENYQASLYNTYLSTPATTYECGYEYNYSYNYFSYDYGYTSPYTYECGYETNPRKSSAYRSYSYAYDNYNAQYNHYNKLVNEYNQVLASVKQDVDRYKNYDYN